MFINAFKLSDLLHSKGRHVSYTSEFGIPSSKANQKTDKKLVCYYALPSAWNKTIPDTLNSTLCTHIIYIGVGSFNNHLNPSPAFLRFFKSSIPALRKQNPKLKIMLCHGGGFDVILQSEHNRTR